MWGSTLGTWRAYFCLIFACLQMEWVGSHLLQLEHRSPSAHLPYLARAPPQTSPGPLRQTSPPQGPGPDPNWQESGWLAGRGVWLLWARGCRHQWGRLRARGQDMSSKIREEEGILTVSWVANRGSATEEELNCRLRALWNSGFCEASTAAGWWGRGGSGRQKKYLCLAGGWVGEPQP